VTSSDRGPVALYSYMWGWYWLFYGGLFIAVGFFTSGAAGLCLEVVHAYTDLVVALYLTALAWLAAPALRVTHIFLSTTSSEKRKLFCVILFVPPLCSSHTPYGNVLKYLPLVTTYYHSSNQSNNKTW
jgi:hypothetical protein